MLSIIIARSSSWMAYGDKSRSILSHGKCGMWNLQNRESGPGTCDSDVEGAHETSVSNIKPDEHL